jgi:hypothetical protein
MEVSHEVFENVCSVSLEMEFEEHVMGYNHSKRNPVEWALLNPGLK